MFGIFPQRQPGEFSDEEVFGAAPAAPAAPPAPQADELSDEEVFGPQQLGDGTEVRATRPTLLERFKANVKDAFTGGTLSGAGSEFLSQKATESALGPEAAADLRAKQREERELYHLIPSFTTAPTLTDQILEGGAAAAGQVAGSLPSPETVISLPYKGATLIGRMLFRGAEQAAINTATDPAVQGINMAAGVRDDYDPVQTALAAPLGFLMGSGIQGGRELPQVFRQWRTARGQAEPTADVTPDEIAAFEASPELRAFMEANGIRDASDPRFVQLEERLAARRQREAETAQRPVEASPEPSNKTPQRQAEELGQELDRKRAERDAIDSGEMNPAAASDANVRRAPVPEVIQQGVSRETPTGERATIVPGRATDPGTQAGFDANSGQLSREQKMELLDRFGFVPDSLETQRRLYSALEGEKARQAEADSQGAYRVSDTAADEGMSSPASRPMEGARRSEARGEFEDTSRPEVRNDQIASGNSDRPFRARDDSDIGVDGRAQAFEQRARDTAAAERARSEDDLLRRWRERAAAEEKMRGRTDDPEYRAANEERSTYERAGAEKTFSTRAAEPDPTAGFKTDKYGNVVSDKGGPVRFADQKQAAKWILNVGHKRSADQVFEIRNHPSGKGFTVRETGRTGPKPPPGSDPKPADRTEPTSDAPPQLVPPRPEVEPATVIRDIKSGAVKPRAADVARKYGLTPERAANMLLEIRSRPDAPITLHDGSSPEGPQFRRAASSRAADLREHQSIAWAEEKFGLRMDDFDDTHAFFDEVGKRMKSADDDTVIEAYRRSAEDDPELHNTAEQEIYDRLEREGMSYDEQYGQRDGSKADDIPFDEPDAGRSRENGEAGREGTSATGAEGEAARATSADQEPGRRDRAGQETAKGQVEIPGTEASARQAQAARDQAGRGGLKGDKPQKAADEGLFDTEGRNQGDIFDPAKFHANPFFDPAVWRAAVGWAKGPLDDWLKHIRDMNETAGAAKESAKLAKLPGQSWLRAAFYGADGEARAVASKLPEQARDLMNVTMNEWHARAGDANGTAKTYEEATLARENSRTNDLAKILSDTADNLSELKQVVRLVQNPAQIRKGTKLGDIADKLTKFLADELRYMREAGTEIGEVRRGYFPRVPDELAIRRKPDEFVRKATDAYMKEGMSRTDADAAAKDLRDRILFGETKGVMHIPGGGISAGFVKGRSFGKAADDILRDFYQQDPRVILLSYIRGSARKAEFTRRVGPDFEKLRATEEAINKAGGGDALPVLREYIATVAGVRGTKTPAWLMNSFSWLRTWSTLGLLEKATLSSLPEPAVAGIRTGNPMDMLASIGMTTSDLLKRTKVGRAINDLVGATKGAEQRRQLAEDLGLIAAEMNTSMNAARWSGGDPSSTLQSKILATYFRSTGLEQFTSATHTAAVGVGQVYLRRLARMAQADKAKGRFELAELGVPTNKIDDFAKWLLKTDNGLPQDIGRITGDMGEVYKNALIRFDRQSVMNPSTATRPRWASTPFGGVVFQLMNFQWAFQENVINRPFRILTQSDLSKADKAKIAGSALAMMTTLPALQLLIGEGRDTLFGDPTKTEPKGTLEKIMLAASRSGLIGKVDPLVNLVTGVRYGRDLATSAAGPSLGRALTGGQTAIEIATRNSERTNTAERKLAKQAYDLIVEPGANYLLSRFAPGGSLTAAAARQAIGSGTVREKGFVEPLLGPPQKRGQHSKEPKR